MSDTPSPHAGNPHAHHPTLLGHPTGLFTLFFAEMWERFSFYGMRALLTLYMIKGFLSYSDGNAYVVYGSYCSLVYMTPFFGGMLADRLLGSRRAVILGGMLMAAGHLMMTIETPYGYFTALSLLICGNGFFKPNISAIVGTLYSEGSHKREGGFTIFYMGVNLGAALSPLICGYIGEIYGWHYGFGLATVGMLLGVAVFVAPSLWAQVAMFGVSLAAAVNIFALSWLVEKLGLSPELPISTYTNIAVLSALAIVGFGSLWELGRRNLQESRLSTWFAQGVIITGAAAAAYILFRFHADDRFSTNVNYLVGCFLLLAGVVAVVALNKGGLPKEAGAAPDNERLQKPRFGPLSAEWLTYLGTAVAVVCLVFLVSGFAPLTKDKCPKKFVSDETIEGMEKDYGMAGKVFAVVLTESSRPAGLLVLLSGIVAFGYLGLETFRLDKVPRERMFVVLILMFFSMIFWAFFEQAGSSLTIFTDRNVDRVIDETKRITEADVGQTIRFRVSLASDDKTLEKLPRLNQEQLGYQNGNDATREQIELAVRFVKEKENEGKVKSEDKEKDKKIKAKEIDELLQDIEEDDLFTMTSLTYLRDAVKEKDAPKGLETVDWIVTDDNVGMAVGGAEIPASVFQSVNPIYIMVFGLIFTALWAILDRRGLDPSDPLKFALGLLQLGLGFAAFWYGARIADPRGMMALSWLFLGYLLHTTGELCLSPVGLAMVTKLSPTRLVGTVMGGWFLATAFSHLFGAIIAQFTKIENASNYVPAPKETLHTYGGVCGVIAAAALVSAVFCFLLVPLLNRWMHEETMVDDDD